MQIRSEVHSDLGLLCARAPSQLDLVSWTAHAVGISAAHRAGNLGSVNHELLDLRDVESFDVDVADLQSLAETLGTYPASLERLALVCHEGTLIQRVLLLRDFMKGRPPEVEVFLSAESAAAWLDTERADLERAQCGA